MPVTGDPTRPRGNRQEEYQAAQRQQARDLPQMEIPTTPPEGDARIDFEPGNQEHVIATVLAFFQGERRGSNIQQATMGSHSPQTMPTASVEQHGPGPPDTSEGAAERLTRSIVTEPEPEPVPDSNAAQGFGGDNLQSGSWTHDLLATLGLPVTQQNVKLLTAWQRAEGGGSNGASRSNFNWLNTTQNAPGAVDINDHHVKSYVSYHQGIMMTAKTLSNGYYGAILAALAAGNDANRVARAIVSSKWGSNDLIIRVLAGMK